MDWQGNNFTPPILTGTNKTAQDLPGITNSPWGGLIYRHPFHVIINFPSVGWTKVLHLRQVKAGDGKELQRHRTTPQKPNMASDIY